MKDRIDKIAKIAMSRCHHPTCWKVLGIPRHPKMHFSFQFVRSWLQMTITHIPHTKYENKTKSTGAQIRLDLGWPRNADGTRTTSKSRTTGRGRMSDSSMTRVKRVTTVVQLGWSGWFGWYLCFITFEVLYTHHRKPKSYVHKGMLRTGLNYPVMQSMNINEASDLVWID